jgi:xylan 1,4-beta-xylosidase
MSYVLGLAGDGVASIQTRSSMRNLQAAGQLESMGSPEWMEVSNGQVMVSVDLPREGISLLHLKW